MSEGDAQEMTRACPDCGHENPYSHRYCEECGGALRSADRVAQTAAPSEVPVELPPIPPPSRRRGVARAVALDKHAARIEFAKVKKVAFRLRAVYALGIAVAIVGLLDYIAISSRGYVVNWPIVLAITAISIGVKVPGVVLVVRQPLIWGIVIAAEHTVTTVLNWIWFLTTDFEPPRFPWEPKPPPGINDLLVFAIQLMLILFIVFVPIYWAAVMHAGRLQKLMAEHPELQLRRGKLETSRHHEGGVADTARVRRVRSRHAGASTALRVIAIVAPVVLVGVGLIWWIQQPAPVTSRIDAFATAWRAGDLDDMDNLFHDGASSRGATSLRESLVRRGWDQRPPKLTGPEVREPNEEYAIAAFTLGMSQVAAHLRLHEDKNAWYLESVDLPTFDPPAIEPFLEKFKTAWATSGTDAVLAHLKDSFRARRGTRIASMFESRDWADDRPALGRYAVKPRSNGRAIVDLETEVGDVNLSCEYWYPRWAITGIRLPRN